MGDISIYDNDVTLTLTWPKKRWRSQGFLGYRIRVTLGLGLWCRLSIKVKVRFRINGKIQV